VPEHQTTAPVGGTSSEPLAGSLAGERTERIDLRPHLRWRDYVPLFRRYNAAGRTRAVLDRYRPLLEGRILDVCCGDSYPTLKAALGPQYEGLDIGDSYKYVGPADTRPTHLWNVEREPLPFADGSFDTVMCISALEHLDNIHQVYDEIFRVARRRVMVMLPNNWVGFIGSLAAGRNYTHPAGYGLGPREKRPGERHKYFFNLEEAAAFLLGRAPAEWRVRQVDCSFELGADTWLANRTYARLAAATRPLLQRKFGAVPGALAAVAASAVYYPVRAVEWAAGMLIWGTRGRLVYHNLMCREIWVVFDRA
jgi:SAM-dependent methyltransferase